MRLEQARVLLTGASGGIGRAMTLALREAGADVLGVGRGALSPLPAGSGWVQADLATPEGLAAVVRAATDWRASGGSAYNLRASAGHVRPLYDISTSFSGGPIACAARLALSRRMTSSSRASPRCTRTVNSASSFARPSQKLRT